jgi:hypothetical protein
MNIKVSTGFIRNISTIVRIFSLLVILIASHDSIYSVIIFRGTTLGKHSFDVCCFSDVINHKTTVDDCEVFL